jgi:hypothetical protein
MKLLRGLPAPLFILAALTPGLGMSSQAKVDGKGVFEAMKSNVAKITEAGEKERWQANLDLWQAVLDQARADK